MRKIVSELDEDIIVALEKDPRATNKAIAALVGASETAVAQRIRAMSSEDVMRVVAQRDVFSGDYTLMALVTIEVANVDPASVGKSIAQIEDVTLVSAGLGKAQLYVSILARSLAHLEYLIRKEFGKISGIKRLSSEVCLEIHKYESHYGWLRYKLPILEGASAPQDKDGRIIACLFEDGRSSNREIGRRLDISEANVRQRLKKMEEAKTMRLAAVRDISTSVARAISLTRISTSPSKSDQVTSALVEMLHVSFVASTSGDYNIAAIISAENQIELTRFCHSKLLPLDGVNDVEINLTTRSIKQRYDWTRII